MDVEAIAGLLHEAAETHHRVYRITDGEDPDWASWYADWLIRLSELPARWAHAGAQRARLPARPPGQGSDRQQPTRPGSTTTPAGWRALHSRRFVAAQRVSSLRLDSCSLRSTFEACDSTVFTEMNSREPISR